MLFWLVSILLEYGMHSYYADYTLYLFNIVAWLLHQGLTYTSLITDDSSPSCALSLIGLT